VSVIIPAYCAAQTISRAVKSILAQTLSPAEIFVIDDGSPDDLASSLAPFGNQVKLVRQANAGAASARNRGIEIAKSDLIAFLDADDYWEPTKLERQVDCLRDNPEVVLSASRYYEQFPGCLRSAPAPDNEHLFDRVLTVNGKQAFPIATRIWTSTVVVRRQMLSKHRFVSGLEPAEDGDLWVRLVLEGPIYLHSSALATAVLEPFSLSRSSIDRCYEMLLRVVRRYGTLLGKRGVLVWEKAIVREWDSVLSGAESLSLFAGPAWNRLAALSARIAPQPCLV